MNSSSRLIVVCVSLLLLTLTFFRLTTGSAQPPNKGAPAKEAGGKSPPVDLEKDGLIRTVRDQQHRIAKLEEAIGTLTTQVNTLRTQLSTLATQAGTLQTRIGTQEQKMTKITDGWFLIRSPMTGNAQTYILDVRGGRPDGHPVLQLEGDNNATPQANRKFRLMLLD
jgi:hypothetical protein